MKLVIFLTAFAFVAVRSWALPASGSRTADSELEQALAEEIKEFHFHIYFFQDNDNSNKSAEILHEKVKRLVELGFFHPVPGTVHHGPVGPHTIGMFYVWCPKEHFPRAYSWFLMHRDIHSVLIHPLTKMELTDHVDRIGFMGEKVPLDTSMLAPLLDHVPLEYPELGLGYSAKGDKPAPTKGTPTTNPELKAALAEEIKEFHFHLYFYQRNAASNTSAGIIHEKVKRLVEIGFIKPHPGPGTQWERPVGPHTIGSFYVWCPKEHFSRMYSWFLLHRGSHQVLVHPLTRLGVIDHSDRAVFIGNDPVPLDNSHMPPLFSHVPLEYPELGLGYSAPGDEFMIKDNPIRDSPMIE